MSTMPVYPTFPSFPTPTAPTTPAAPSTPSSGGALDWLKNWLKGISPGDVIGAVGSGVGGYLDYQTNQAALAQQKKQFEDLLKQRQDEYSRTTGNTEGQMAVQAQTALNKAPMADKAQALLLSRMGTPPTMLHARDWTQGVDQMRGSARGGPQDQIAAGQRDAGAYVPGAGGVDTDTIRLLLAKMRGSAGLSAQPSGPTTGVGYAPPSARPPITTPGSW